MQEWQRLPEEAPLGADALSPGGKGRCRGEVDPGSGQRRPKSGVGGSFGSAGVVPARPARAAPALQAAHRRACAHRVRRAALRLPSGSCSGLQLPGRPLLRQEPGSRGP